MDELLGHEDVLAFLRHTVEQGRPAHAYLFTGREGLGKRKVAVRFAAMLNCPDLAVDPNLACRACTRVINGKHPDLTLVTPEPAMIRVDRIRSLQEQFRYAPVEGRFRVALIDDADRMNPQAQNALLKTLEEPPAGRILILVSARPSVLLPTVRSRCRRIRFGPLPLDQVASIVQTETSVDRTHALTIAGIAGGIPGRALMMTDASYGELVESLVAFMTDPGEGGLAGLLRLSARLAGDGTTAARGIEIALTIVRDMLVCTLDHEAIPVIHVNALDRISRAAHHHSAETLLEVWEEVRKAGTILDREINVNRFLVMDVLLLRMARLLGGPTFGVSVEAG